MKLADFFKRSEDTEANVAQLTQQIAALQTQAGELDTVNKALTNRVAELESKLYAAHSATAEANDAAATAKAQADAAAAKAKADADAKDAADKKKFDDAVNLRAAELALSQGAASPLPAGKQTDAPGATDAKNTDPTLKGLDRVAAAFAAQPAIQAAERSRKR